VARGFIPPGLYSNGLARLGHTCFGIDFSPASIGYARETAAAEGLACTYREADLRTAEFEPEVDTALFLFGECNVFRPAELRDILARAAQALKPGGHLLLAGGHLLLEPSTPEAITRIGQQPATWSAHNEGLFSDRPHLLLHEAFWDEAQRVSTDRYFVVDADTGVVTRHAASQCAHLPEELIALLHAVGFTAVERVPAWDAGRSFSGDFLALVASR